MIERMISSREYPEETVSNPLSLSSSNVVFHRDGSVTRPPALRAASP
jgi:hypothetical protein